MGLPKQGAQAPFFIPGIPNQVIPKLRYESLLEQAIASFKRQAYADALVFAEIACRYLPDNHFAALFRTRVIELQLPSLSLRAGYLAWRRKPKLPLMQDSLLQQWHDAGARQATIALAQLFLAQRIAISDDGSLRKLLSVSGAEFVVACWAQESSLVIDFEFFEAGAQTNYLLKVSSDEANYQYELAEKKQRIILGGLDTSLAWSVCLEHKSQSTRITASGSPVRLRVPEISNKPVTSNTTQTDLVILIPVYQDFQQVAACISSVLSSFQANTCKARLLVIDDASPDAALSNWLQQLAGKQRIELMTNKVNLGFIETVNRGLQATMGQHVLLLNSDTRVSGNWLDKMLESLQSDQKIASVSAWSNNGEISSFPIIAEASLAPEAEQLSELQQQLQSVCEEQKLADQELPVCCGFAMLMHAKAIQQVGLLDGYHLSRGYAEEVDWCLRASEAGYKHLLNPQVFIAHHGSSSFKFEKYYRVAQNLDYIHSRYPSYQRHYQRFIAKDGLASIRKKLIHHLKQKNNTWLMSQQANEDNALLSLPPQQHQSCGECQWIVIWDNKIADGMHSVLQKLSRDLLLLAPKTKLLITGEVFDGIWATGNSYVLPKVHNKEIKLLEDSQLLAGLNIKLLLTSQIERFTPDPRIRQLGQHFDLAKVWAELRALPDDVVLTTN